MKIPFREIRKVKDQNGYLLWGLIAIELFMSFSFLGYIHIEPISLTFVYIPVLIAGCILGAKEAALVGTVFGLASMWKASAFYVSAGDAIFSPVMSGKPVQSILLSVASRALFGFIVGMLYQWAKKGKHPMAGIILVSALGRTIHALLVYGFMELLFPEAGFTVANVLDDTLRWDFPLFVLLSIGIILLCCFFVKSRYVRRLFERIRQLDQISAVVSNNRGTMLVMLILVLLASFSVAIYFTDRINMVMAWHHIEVTEEIAYDLMHLQIQFLFGMIALALMVIIVIILHQKNLNYLYYEAKLDGLTGLLGRQHFFQLGEELLNHTEPDRNGNKGYFIILDIDRFKAINDRCGHPEGDRVLREVAGNLNRVFGKMGILGRLGGDEFVVLVNHSVQKNEIEKLMHELKNEIGKIQLRDQKVTCSVGVVAAEKAHALEELYRSADLLLYEAKKKGKDQFVLGHHPADAGQ